MSLQQIFKCFDLLRFDFLRSGAPRVAYKNLEGIGADLNRVLRQRPISFRNGKVGAYFQFHIIIVHMDIVGTKGDFNAYY